jgi:hypothetical protein
MPWEITIRQADNGPLGDLSATRKKIMTALPATQFYREPSGPEKIAAAAAKGIVFPDVIRKHLEQRPATEQALFEGDGYSIELYGFEGQPLQMLLLEVRGDGNPMPALAAICRPNGWIVIDNASGKPVDLDAVTAAAWDAFQAFRDRAIRSIKTSQGQ